MVASAVLFALSFPSVVNLEGIGLLAWFCLIPLFLVLLTKSPGMGIFYGTGFGVLQALIINYWHGTYKYVTLHLITIAFFVQFLLFMVVLVWLIRMSGKWGFLVVTAAWVFFDYCRSISILGYPWGLIGTTQYRFLSLIQMASLTGVWGISFVILLRVPLPEKRLTVYTQWGDWFPLFCGLAILILVIMNNIIWVLKQDRHFIEYWFPLLPYS